MSDEKAVNPLFDPKAQQEGELLVNPGKIKVLNAPPVDPTGFNEGDLEFLNMVIQKVSSKEIDLLQPSSLVNHAIYDKLPEDQQGKVDLDAMSLLGKIRQIYDLFNVNKNPTFMIQNLILDVKHTKERLEEISGDIFII